MAGTEHPVFQYYTPEGGSQDGGGSADLMMMCCECGAIEKINPTRKCTACLRNEVDAAADVEKQVMLQQCRGCERYQTAQGWLTANWESKELMALCLKKTRGLTGRTDVRLVDAQLIYTEPHSKRVRIRCVLQKQIEHGAIIEQSCIVEYILQSVQCEDCKRSYTPHLWKAVVQVRQRAEHKKSLLYLEQMILKYDAHENVLRMVAASDGFDFQFASKQSAQKFVDFVASVLPSKFQHTRSLVSHDSKSNTVNYKYTFYQEVCPVVKDDLVFLPSRVASLLGGLAPFCVCVRIGRAIRLLDPFTLRGSDVPSEKYWKNPFQALFTRRHLSEFVVLDIEPVDMASVPTAATAKRFLHKQSKKKSTNAKQRALADSFASKGAGESEGTADAGHMEIDCESASCAISTAQQSGQQNVPTEHPSDHPYILADVEIARSHEIGVEDSHLRVRTHLGKYLRTGDVVLGYDLRTINLSGFDDAEADYASKCPYEAVLVRKIVPPKSRNWLLQKLPVEDGTGMGQIGDNEALEEFKQDIENDPQLRKDVNLWKDPRPRRVRRRRGKKIGQADVDMGNATETEAEAVEDVDDADEVDQLAGLLEGLTLENAYDA